ncbi:MAG: NERD domain-containing protein [Burkholderiales bacterium]|nr:NERD domain-containing protein [Burkholderiales bacterium]
MLIKSADDKSKRLRLLEDLQASPVLDGRQRHWLRDARSRETKGIQGERDAAFHIDSVLRDSKNWAVLHDLRIRVGEDEAQIDHLILNRFLDLILVETKCFGCSLEINAQGEFTADYGSGKRFGIDSPLAQSERHGRVLLKLLEQLEIGGRLGIKPAVHHLVLLHPKAIIQRPAAEQFDTSNVIKADQFAQWRERFVDESAKGLSAVTGVLNMRSSDTLREWAEKIARQHRPADPQALPGLKRPKEAAPFQVPTVVPALAAAPAASAEPTAAAGAPAKRLVCATCGAKISYPEGKFCWNNPKRFGGLQYCREHQAAFAANS